MISKPVREKNWLKEHPSNHQKITGDEAERRLKEKGGHCYLTRFSKFHDCYILSVYKKQHPDDVFEHFKIIVKNGKKSIDGLDREFDDIHSLLGHYEHQRIDAGLKSIGKAYTEDDYAKEQDKKCTIL